MCIFIYVYIYVYIDTYIYIYIHTRMHTHIYTYICIYIHTHIYTYMYIRIYIHTHTYIYTYNPFNPTGMYYLDLNRKPPPPRGGFLFTMFPHQEPWVRGPFSKNLYQILFVPGGYLDFADPIQRILYTYLHKPNSIAAATEDKRALCSRQKSPMFNQKSPILNCAALTSLSPYRMAKTQKLP